MGAFLPTPKTEKQFDSGDKAGLVYALSAMQGWRVEMEDAHTIEVKDELGKDTCLFAVFDGHAGQKVAQKASTELLKNLKKTPKFTALEKMGMLEVDDMMKAGFKSLDKELKDETERIGSTDRSGSTALVCIITPTRIIFSNCGDSRGFLCRDNNVQFATDDHKPYNEKEKVRIEKAGGTVMMQRVNGSLAVSRALGDFDYKNVDQLDAFDQMVSPEPETTVIDRTEKDEFVVLACDGIYDVMPNLEIKNFVRSKLKEGMDLKLICSKLIDICLNKNSRDNMTVILITFPGAPTENKEYVEKVRQYVEDLKEKIAIDINDTAKSARDPLDLDVMSVWAMLEGKWHKGDYDDLIPKGDDDDDDPFAANIAQEFYLLKDYISETVEKLREEKFGPQDSFSREDNDPHGYSGQVFENMLETKEEMMESDTIPEAGISHSSSDDSVPTGSPPKARDDSKPMEDS